jgi:hypothetical protein
MEEIVNSQFNTMDVELTFYKIHQSIAKALIEKSGTCSVNVYFNELTQASAKRVVWSN